MLPGNYKLMGRRDLRNNESMATLIRSKSIDKKNFLRQFGPGGMRFYTEEHQVDSKILNYRLIKQPLISHIR